MSPTFFKVALVQICDGVIAGGVAAFLISFDNISLSLFITRGDALPLRLLQQLLACADPSTSAISTLLVVVSLVSMVFLLPRAMRQRPSA
ncbi:hypothetical protein AB8B21_31400 [Tardiphaga sp. 866_E4_N2_1]|uniref:hypothetical protein n=1 Tax=unclassified Tardiphaga TaxID=2631404 RepID=UPI003F1FEFA8